MIPAAFDRFRHVSVVLGVRHLLYQHGLLDLSRHSELVPASAELGGFRIRP